MITMSTDPVKVSTVTDNAVARAPAIKEKQYDVHSYDTC